MSHCRYTINNTKFLDLKTIPEFMTFYWTG